MKSEKRLEKLSKQLENLEGNGSASKWYIKNMRLAIDALQENNIDAVFKHLILVLIDFEEENRPN